MKQETKILTPAERDEARAGLVAKEVASALKIALKECNRLLVETTGTHFRIVYDGDYTSDVLGEVAWRLEIALNQAGYGASVEPVEFLGEWMLQVSGLVVL